MSVGRKIRSGSDGSSKLQPVRLTPALRGIDDWTAASAGCADIEGRSCSPPRGLNVTKSPVGVLGLASFRGGKIMVSTRHKPGMYGVVKLSPLLTCEMKSLQ